MKRFTALALVGLGLLFTLAATRAPTAGSPATTGHIETTHPILNRADAANKRSPTTEGPGNRIGGIWFW